MTHPTNYEQLQVNNAKIISEFNQPYKTVVAIDCSEIGDDNDYSCLLFEVVRELWAAGKKELAVKMANTDSMRSEKCTVESFEVEYNEWLQLKNEISETESAYQQTYIH